MFEHTHGASTANGHTKAAHGDESVLEEGDRRTPAVFVESDTTASGPLLMSPMRNEADEDSSIEDEKEDQRMFDALERPRIRYDVEVITKLVVYAGIGCLSVEVNPLLFRKLGLA